MSNDDIKRILAAIEELRSENALAHRGLDAKIEDVRKTQGDHTVSLKLISEFTGVLPHMVRPLCESTVSPLVAPIIPSLSFVGDSADVVHLVRVKVNFSHQSLRQVC